MKGLLKMASDPVAKAASEPSTATEAGQERGSKPKDVWDKIDVIGKLIGSILVPVAVAVVGLLINTGLQSRSDAEKTFEIAVQVLQSEKSTRQPDLYRWALGTVTSTVAKSDYPWSEAVQRDVTQRPLPTPYGRGSFAPGTVSAIDSVAAHPEEVAGIAPSLRRIVLSLSRDAGNLDSVQTFDSRVLSFGLLQWSLGGDDQPGELAGLLARLKKDSPEAFQQYFGRLGLDTVPMGVDALQFGVGYLVLNGKRLDTAAAKEVLRSPSWVAAFGEAGKDPAVQQAQLLFFVDEVKLVSERTIRGLKLSNWVSSEYGIALVTDEFLDRPAHVPGTLASILDKAIQKIGKPDPVTWTTADEATLLDAYLDARAETSMVHSQGRAQRIKQSVEQGQLSAERGSFRPSP
jgi:hypothetical protein